MLSLRHICDLSLLCSNPAVVNLHDSELNEAHGRGVVKRDRLDVTALNVLLLEPGLLVPPAGGLCGLGVRSLLRHGPAGDTRKRLLGPRLRLGTEFGRRVLLGGEALGAVDVLLDVGALSELAFIE